MSSRYTSAFDDLLDKNRRELDALYQGTAPSTPSRPPPAPAPAPATAAREPGPAPTSAARPPGTDAVEPAPAAPAAPPPPATSPAERLLNERYGDGWRFEVTSRRREKDEVVVVGTLRLSGAGGVRTQFGSAPIGTGGGTTAGSSGGVAFAFGGGSTESPLRAEEAAFERAREDALANCATLL